MAFSLPVIYDLEGDIETYTMSISPDVQLPVDVIVSLPPGSTQGAIAPYDSATQTYGAFVDEFRVTLDPANPRATTFLCM